MINYSGVQALRFIAAMMVVTYHATAMVTERIIGANAGLSWESGAAGVDLFFVISGFVMTVSSQNLNNKTNAWKVFIIHRIVRVVPLYWFATTAKVILVLLLPSLALSTQLSFWSVLFSYFFIPTFSESGSFVEPVLKVGWTLYYEMFFYLVFSVGLFFRLSPFLFVTFCFFVCVLVNIYSTPEYPFLWGFLSPIILEFIMGMIVAKLCVNKFVSLWGCVLLVFCGFMYIFFVDIDLDKRWVHWGMASMLIVASVVMAEKSINKFVSGFIARLGDSSYSLYIFHTFIVPLVGVVFVKLGWVDKSILAVVVCVVVCPFVAFFIYKYIEKPVTIKLKTYLDMLVFRV